MPDFVDRLIVHQHDAARPSPGGIDTCLRGIGRYLPPDMTFAFVGVDATGDNSGRQLGEWEEYDRGSGTFWFMPVVRLDPGDQRRRLPHSLRVVLGTLRYHRRLPKSEWYQAHRMDTAWSLRWILGRRTAYFVHTQENGLTGQVSDSFWKVAAKIHKRLERRVVRDASQVVVFNEQYAEVVKQWNPRTQASPTWYDPDLIKSGDLETRDTYAVIWAGRLEVPKDPILALQAFKALAESDPHVPWRLHMLGSGTLQPTIEEVVATFPSEVSARIELHGRTVPERVADTMATSGVFLMTSHPGYEGFPRVLVEALASGLPAVVTDGADTGHLVRNNENGFVTTRDPLAIAKKLKEASVLPRSESRASAARLSAPEVINAIYANGGL